MISPGIVHARVVNAVWELVCLDLVVSQLTGDELDDEVILERLELGVICEVRKERFGANCDLCVDKVAPHFVLKCLLLEADVLLVNFVRR